VGSDGTLYYSELNLNADTSTGCGRVSQVRFVGGMPQAPEVLGRNGGGFVAAGGELPHPAGGPPSRLRRRVAVQAGSGAARQDALAAATRKAEPQLSVEAYPPAVAGPLTVRHLVDGTAPAFMAFRNDFSQIAVPDDALHPGIASA
jgi:hypothetical protein